MNSAMLQRFDLAGKTVVITGGGGALCGAMADALGTMGVKVAVLDISREKAEVRAQAITRSGGTALALGCDVLDADQLRKCRDSIAAAWGPPGLLINGAGGNDPRGSTSVEFEEPAKQAAAAQSFFDLDPAGFRQVFDLNFMGTFLATQIFSRGMVAGRKGSIVNVSSMSAFMPLTKVAAYSAAKAAVSNFTQWLAVHFSQNYSPKIRVNAIAPGFFLTEQNRFLLTEKETGNLTARGKSIIEHTPMNRFGDPVDLVGAVLWLLSPASQFVHGAVISIDGGFSAFSGV